MLCLAIAQNLLRFSGEEGASTRQPVQPKPLLGVSSAARTRTSAPEADFLEDPHFDDRIILRLAAAAGL
jgi:hypothetical protein